MKGSARATARAVAGPPPPPLRPAATPAQLPPAIASPAEEPLVGGTRTELGGLFFLLNVALFLELYADFTRPLERGLRLDPWDLVTLLGRELLGDAHDDDPVWTLLAGLAGRDASVPPGRGFVPPRDWRLPPAWLEPFADEKRPWRFSAAGGRLRVQHPARFTVLDVPLGRNPRVHLTRALRAYGRPDCAAGLFFRELDGPPLERWVSRLAAYARARLQLALGIGERELARTLLQQPARVLVTATRVDVVVPLESLAVEVRLAGLDRDPGWIPAAARDVRFHFE